MEVVESRCIEAMEFLHRLLDTNSVPQWVGDRVHTIKANAASPVNTPIIVNGEHPSHIFMFSRVFHKDDLRDISLRLNMTDYKVVVCCVDPGQIKRGCFYLENAVELKDRIIATISGSGASY
jgi:hypothetical protein